MTARVFIAGKTPPAMARRAARRAANSNYQPGQLDGWQMNALQRRSDMDRLARLRARRGDFGSEVGWIEVVANYLRVRHGTVSAADVHREAAWLGLPKLDQTLVTDAVEHIGRAAWGRYQLFGARLAGAKLQLSKDERAAAQIIKMDAVDEPADERRRRMDRERKASKRAAEAALAPKMPKTLIAKLLGISRAELYRRLNTGEIDETDLVRLS